MGQLSKNSKGRNNIVFLAFLEIQGKQNQEKALAFVCFMRHQHGILKKAMFFNVLWNTSTTISFPMHILEL